VGLIAENPSGDILLVQEFENKAWLGKLAGMFSIPMETRHEDEQEAEALVRLWQEELPGLPLPTRPCSYIGAYQVVPRIWAKVYAVRTESNDLPNGPSFRSEVGNYRWALPEDALREWLRRGAREMIADFRARRRDVLCRECIDPLLRRRSTAA
jgi:hypothetical protein